MTINQMRKQLEKWNPHWRSNTIKTWSDKQILAIYTKQLSKHSKDIQKNNYKQLSFF